MAPKLVLIGPMGAGKTTVGRDIAEKLNCAFADTDALIEADQGKSVSEIFVEDGEPHFRLVEESVVIDALISEEGVLSLGGGAVMNDAVQEALRTSPAKKVFLDISLAAVAPRVGEHDGLQPVFDRPAIQYAMEEAVAAGIERIVLVTSDGKRAIEDHFDAAPDLEAFLEARGDIEHLRVVRAVSDMVNLVTVRQKEQLGLGHAVLCARSLVGDEPFAVLLADDLVLAPKPCAERK